MMRHVAKKYTRKLRRPAGKGHTESEKPEWDTAVNDLSRMKLSKTELERRLSARKPKLPRRVGEFPGFHAQADRGQGCSQHSGFAAASSTKGLGERDGHVDYSAVVQSLQNLPADLIASAPVRRARSRSGSGGSDGYRSDGVVDFQLEVQQFEARTFNNKFCSNGLPPFPAVSGKSAARHEGHESGEFDLSTAHMRPSHRSATGSTGNSSSIPGSLPELSTPSLRSREHAPTTRSIGSDTGGIRTGPRHNDQSAARKRRGAEAVTRPSTTQAPRTDDRWILERVEAMEKQLEVLAGVPSTLRALQATVDRLSADQGELRCEVSGHCSHASSLISQLQAQISSVVTGTSIATLAETVPGGAKPQGARKASPPSAMASVSRGGPDDLEAVRQSTSMLKETAPVRPVDSFQPQGARQSRYHEATIVQTSEPSGTAGSDPLSACIPDMSAQRIRDGRQCSGPGAFLDKGSASNGARSPTHISSQGPGRLDEDARRSTDTLSAVDRTNEGPLQQLDILDSSTVTKLPANSVTADRAEYSESHCDNVTNHDLQLPYASFAPTPDSPLGLKSAVISNSPANVVHGADRQLRRDSCSPHAAGDSCSPHVQQENGPAGTGRSKDSHTSVASAIGHSDNSLRDLMNVINAAGARSPTRTSIDFLTQKDAHLECPAADAATHSSDGELDDTIVSVAVEPLQTPSPSAGQQTPNAAPLSAVDQALANASAEWQRRSLSASKGLTDLSEWRMPSGFNCNSVLFTKTTGAGCSTSVAQEALHSLHGDSTAPANTTLPSSLSPALVAHPIGSSTIPQYPPSSHASFNEGPRSQSRATRTPLSEVSPSIAAAQEDTKSLLPGAQLPDTGVQSTTSNSSVSNPYMQRLNFRPSRTVIQSRSWLQDDSTVHQSKSYGMGTAPASAQLQSVSHFESQAGSSISSGPSGFTDMTWLVGTRAGNVKAQRPLGGAAFGDSPKEAFKSSQDTRADAITVGGMAWSIPVEDDRSDEYDGTETKSSAAHSSQVESVVPSLSKPGTRPSHDEARNQVASSITESLPSSGQQGRWNHCDARSGAARETSSRQSTGSQVLAEEGLQSFAEFRRSRVSRMNL